MDEKIEVIPELFDLDMKEKTRKDVLEHLVDLLEEHDCVNGKFREKILERERVYPTGLSFPGITIAIPHGDSACVKKSVIAVGRCRQKVPFFSMEDPDESLMVDMVVMLAIRNPDSHVILLNNLIEMFTGKENCKKLLSENQVQAVCEIFRKNLNKGEQRL